MSRKPKRRPVEQVFGETPERAQHAAAIVDRALGTAMGLPKGRLVQTPLDRLAMRGSISPRMQTAGLTLRDDFDLGVMGAKDIPGEQLGIKSAFGPSWVTDTQIDAMTAYKAAMKALGAHVGAVVVALCCYEYDVVTIATQQGRNRDKVMGVVEDGLKTLADHYKLPGRD